MEEVVAAIRYIFSPALTGEQQAEANKVIVNCMNDFESCFTVGFATLNDPSSEHIFLQSGTSFLLHFVREHWNNASNEKKTQFLTSLSSIIASPAQEQPRSVRHSLAQCFAEIAVRQFPQQWPTLLDDLNNLTTSVPDGITMALTVFSAIGNTLADTESAIISKKRRNEIIIGFERNLPTILKFFTNNIAAAPTTAIDCFGCFLRYYKPTDDNDETQLVLVLEEFWTAVLVIDLSNVDIAVSTCDALKQILEYCLSRKMASKAKEAFFTFLLQDSTVGKFQQTIAHFVKELTEEVNVEYHSGLYCLENFIGEFCESLFALHNKVVAPLRYCAMLLELVAFGSPRVVERSMAFWTSLLRHKENTNLLSWLSLNSLDLCQELVNKLSTVLVSSYNTSESAVPIQYLQLESDHQTAVSSVGHWRHNILLFFRLVQQLHGQLVVAMMNRWLGQVKAELDKFDTNADQVIYVVSAMATVFESTNPKLNEQFYKDCFQLVEKTAHSNELVSCCLQLTKSLLPLIRCNTDIIINSVQVVTSLLDGLLVGGGVAVAQGSVRTLREHCCRFVLRCCLVAGSAIVPVFDHFNVYVSQLLGRSDLNQVEVDVLCQALVAAANSIDDGKRAQLFRTVLADAQNCLSNDCYYSSEKPVQRFMFSIGLIVSPEAATIRRNFVHAVVKLLGILRHSRKFPANEETVRQIVTDCVGRIHLISCVLNVLWTAEARALAETQLKNAYLVSGTAGEGKTEANSIRNFLQTAVISCYNILNESVKLFPDFVLANQQTILRDIVGTMHHLPAHHLRPVVGGYLSRLVGFNVDMAVGVLRIVGPSFGLLLRTEWLAINRRLSSEDQADGQEGLNNVEYECEEDATFAAFSLEYINLLRNVMLKSTTNEDSNDDGDLTEVGQRLMETTEFEEIFLMLAESLSWRSKCFCPASRLLSSMVPSLEQTQYLDAVEVLTKSVLNGIHFNGADTADVAIYNLCMKLFVLFVLPNNENSARFRQLFQHVLPAKSLEAFEKSLRTDEAAGKPLMNKASRRRFRDLVKSINKQILAEMYKFDGVRDLRPVRRAAKSSSRETILARFFFSFLS